MAQEELATLLQECATEENKWELYDALTNSTVKLPAAGICSFTWREVGDILYRIFNEESTDEYGYLHFYCSGSEGTLTKDAKRELAKVKIEVA